MEATQQDSGLRLNQVHYYERVPGTQQVKLMQVNPVVRICQGTAPPLFIQNGRVYAEGGDLIPKEELPEWFHEQVKLMTPQARIECGYRFPTDPRPRLPGEQEGEKFYMRDGKFYNEDGKLVPGLSLAGNGPEPSPAQQGQKSEPAGHQYGEKTFTTKGMKETEKEVKMWVCPRCAEEVPLQRKGVHTMAHRRADKKAG